LNKEVVIPLIIDAIAMSIAALCPAAASGPNSNVIVMIDD